MSKIVVFLSKDYMLKPTYRALDELDMEVEEVKVIKTTDAINEARRVVENGASIIIARGAQAQYIRGYTNTPLVEIVATGQEISLLISNAIKQLKKEKPIIALCGLKNMFSNTAYFNDIFDVDFRTYFVETIDELREKSLEAVKDGADYIIGGDITRETVIDYNVIFHFLECTEDSIGKALDTAKKMAYTEETVKNYVADFETVLDSAVQSIIKVDLDKNITAINKVSEELFGVSKDVVVGESIEGLIPELKGEYIDSILSSSRDIFNISIKIDNIPTMLTVLPIENENIVLGAIVTCYRLNVLNRPENNIYRSMHLKGFVTDSTFENINTKDKHIKKTIELAKTYALSKKPILINGETGTEKEFYAQCIHNVSIYKNGPFVTVNCGGMSELRQIELLFGFFRDIDDNDINKVGALEASNGGTLYISEIDKLSPICQYRLFRAIQYKTIIQNDLERTLTIDNRIILSTNNKLEEKVEKGEFREDLYYVLNSLVLDLPNLSSRDNEIEEIVKMKIIEYSKEYSKFLRISDNAMEAICKYEWRGNIIQLEAFCERLFLTTRKKMISDDQVTHLLEELYPNYELKNGERKIVIYKNPEGEKILKLLEKYHGNRGKVAKELGVSTTTLWRKMKKYGVEID